MSEKYFLLTTKHIVKAPNMTQAKFAVEGEDDFLGEILKESTETNEVSNSEAAKYIGFSEVNIKPESTGSDDEDFEGRDLREVQRV